MFDRLTYSSILTKEVNRIAILAEHPYALYSSFELLDEANRLGVEIVFILREDLGAFVPQVEHSERIEVVFIEAYYSKIAKKLTDLFELIFVNHGFSQTYSSRKAKKWSASKLWFSERLYLFKLKKSQINSVYSRVFRFLSKYGFIPELPVGDVDLIFSFTKENNPYLLSPYSTKHISIMESWDHPMKEPYFITPATHLTWNQDLAAEVKEYQYLPYVAVIQSIPKFQYLRLFDEGSSNALASINSPKLIRESKLLDGRRYYLYPMCTSSAYYGFEGEVEFVRDLARHLSSTDILLYIRPYPLAPEEDTAKLREIPGCHVGALSLEKQGFDVLSHEAQAHKYWLIKHAVAVINIGTTFALDAALVGCPVLQLKLLNDDFGVFSDYSRGGHIRKYLWTEHSVEYRKGRELNIVNLVNEKAKPYSVALNSWLRDV